MIGTLHHGCFESVTPADRRHLQVQRRMPRVTAVIEQLLRCLVASANGRDLLGLRMRLAEMETQAALSIVKLLHASPPLKDSSRAMPQIPRSGIENPSRLVRA